MGLVRGRGCEWLDSI